MKSIAEVQTEFGNLKTDLAALLKAIDDAKTRADGGNAPVDYQAFYDDVVNARNDISAGKTVVDTIS